MAVKVIIPFHLNHYTGGISDVVTPGGTVRDAILSVTQQHPRLARVLFPDSRDFDQFINVALNGKILLPNENPLDVPVRDGDVIEIIFPLPGG